jgi:nitroreductase
MDVLEAICSRRSIREYAERPVPLALLERVLDAARLAPSSGNSQPWRFVVVVDPARIRVIKWMAPGIHFEPPALIVICWQQHEKYSSPWRQHLRASNCYLAAENIALSACELGLGTCMIGSFAPSAVVEVLSLPDYVHPELLMTIGYPQSIPEQRPRLPMNRLAYLDQWGHTWTEQIT